MSDEHREAELLDLLGSLTPFLNDLASVTDLATGPARAAIDGA
jgi:hypothetical protein